MPEKFSDFESSEPAVFILDSGAGAHSLLSECLKLRPELHYIILEDSSFFPYGEKTVSQLEKRFEQLAKNISRHSPLALILACNTASTHGIDLFRKELKCPVIGVVPPVKPAAKQTMTGQIALLATPATSSSPYTAKLIADFAKGTQVHIIPTPGLAKIGEEYFRTNELCFQSLSHELIALNEISNLDTIALGCTHYHHLKEHIQVLFPDCHVLDCSPAVARQFDRVCPQKSNSDPAILEISI